MPTYEYRCPEGHEFETIQKMSDPPIAECPECGSEAERLLSTGAGFLFKGPGFYITDYRSDAYREQARKEEAFSSSKAAGSKSATNGGGEGGTASKDGASAPKPESGTAAKDGSSTSSRSSGGGASTPPAD